jgi:signal transduction histidine kinase
VTDHGGQVVVHSPAGGGSEISILLPLSIHAAIEQPPAC